MEVITYDKNFILDEIKRIEKENDDLRSHKYVL